MKKKLVLCLLFATILLAWCTDSDKFIEIDSDNWLSDQWLSAKQVFDNQIQEAQYLKDLEKYISYNVLSYTENKPFNSDFSLNIKFDDVSSVQWWLDFFQKKFSKKYDLESRDIKFDIEARQIQEDSEPFDASGSVTLLYQDNEMYANLHDFGVFMGEGNMVAKMYTLLGDMIIDRWVNLEINSGGIISVNEKEDIKLQYITWNLLNVLKTDQLYDSPNFLNSVAELIDTLNSHVDLWISTNWLSLKTVWEIKYSEANWIIQKEFRASFEWYQSAFDLSFIASQNWLEIYLYNIKEFDSDLQKFVDLDSEFFCSLKEIKKSEYEVAFWSTKSQQKIVDMQWNIDFNDTIKFGSNFILEPLELVSGQKISWRLDGYLIKQSAKWDEVLPELSWDIVLFSDLLSSL